MEVDLLLDYLSDWRDSLDEERSNLMRIQTCHNFAKTAVALSHIDEELGLKAPLREVEAFFKKPYEEVHAPGI